MAVKGIFEPFKKYVKKQLDLRKKIISNSKGNKVISNKRYEKDPELFFAYAQEKQCIIRMMSGVDLKPQEFLTEGLLEEGYEDKKLLLCNFFWFISKRFYNQLLRLWI